MAYARKRKWQCVLLHPLAGRMPGVPTASGGFVPPAPLATAIGGASATTYVVVPEEGGFARLPSPGFSNLGVGGGSMLVDPSVPGFIGCPAETQLPDYSVNSGYMSFWNAATESSATDQTNQLEASGALIKKHLLRLEGAVNSPGSYSTKPIDGRTLQIEPGMFDAVYGRLLGRMRANIVDSGSELGDTKAISDGKKTSYGRIAKFRGMTPQKEEMNVYYREGSNGTSYVLVDEDSYQKELTNEVAAIAAHRSALAKWAASGKVGARPVRAVVTSKWTEEDAATIRAEIDRLDAAYTRVADDVVSPEAQQRADDAYARYKQAGGGMTKEQWLASQLSSFGAAADAQLGAANSNSGFLSTLKESGNWLLDSFSKFTSSLGDTGGSILGIGIASKLTGLSQYLPVILLGVGVLLILK